MAHLHVKTTESGQSRTPLPKQMNCYPLVMGSRKAGQMRRWRTSSCGLAATGLDAGSESCSCRSVPVRYSAGTIDSVVEREQNQRQKGQSKRSPEQGHRLMLEEVACTARGR